MFFATHFTDLTQLDVYDNVHNFHLSGPADNGATAGAPSNGAFKLTKGPLAESTYGAGS